MTDRPLDPPLATSFFGKNLRLGIWNCASIDNIEYCISSNCDVIALQETGKKTPNSSQIEGYTYHFNTSLTKGLGFLVRNSRRVEYIGRSDDQTTPAWLKFKFDGVQCVFYNIYAPTCSTKDSQSEKSEKYYKELKEVFLEVRKKSEFVVVFGGDMNAFPKKASEGCYEPWIGSHVNGSDNSHGQFLVDFLRSVKTFHLNSRFSKEIDKKWTYCHTSNGPRNELDGFISDRIDIVHDVNVFEKKQEGKLRFHRLVYSDWRISPSVEALMKKMRAQKRLVEELSYYQDSYDSRSQGWSKDKKMGDLIIFINRMYLEAMTIELTNPLNSLPQNGSKMEHLANEVRRHLKRLFCLEEEQSKNSADSLQSNINSSDSENIFTEKNVSDELQFLILKHPPGLDLAFLKIVEVGGEDLVNKLTTLCNEIVLDGKSSDDFKTITCQLPNQKNNAARIEEYKFEAFPSLLATVYSNLLARKLNLEAGNYIHSDQLMSYDNSIDVECLRQKKSVEIIMKLTLWIKAFRNEKKLFHFIIIDFPNAFERIKLSSVIDILSGQNVTVALKTAFTALLQNCTLTIDVNGKNVAVSKKRGLHFGDIANKTLMGLVMRMILDKELNDEEEKEDDEKEEKHNDENANAESDEDEGVKEENLKGELDGEEKDKETPEAQSEITEASFQKKFHFDNMIILVDSDFKNLKSRSLRLCDVAEKHGLENHEIHLFTNYSSLVGTTIFLGDKKVEERSTNNFRCSYFSKDKNPISDLLSDAAQERKKAKEIAIYATMPDFLSKSVKDKEEFFKFKLLPSLFYNCETWKPNKDEENELQEFVAKFRKLSNLPGDFCVKKHIGNAKHQWLQDNKEEVKKLLKEIFPEFEDEEHGCKWLPDSILFSYLSRL